MYADFYLYTDLFLKIPDFDSPYKRMKQVLRWYMSTFRSCRKNSLAKKPYNPILGEIFECWYNTSLTETQGTCENKLKFIGEQVSHHPPISAFYLEHLNKRIQLEGYSWTKSNFMGYYASIATIGKSVLTLLGLQL